jgi:hypothetical protein
MTRAGLALAGALLLGSGLAHATTINYSVADLSGNTWSYEYSVTNDTLGLYLTEFTVYFDRNLYSDLAVGASPVNWSPLVAQPDPALPADGFYDALSFDIGLAPGGQLGGFVVDFNYLGSGAPASQKFDIVDSSVSPIALLDSGVTQPAAAGVSVPESDSTALLAIGLGLCAASALFQRSKGRRARLQVR